MWAISEFAVKKRAMNRQSPSPELLSGGVSLKTLAEEIRRPDKKRPAIAFEPRFRLPRKRVKTIVIKVIVVPDVKGRSGIRIPSEKELPAGIRPQRIVIPARADVCKP